MITDRCTIKIIDVLVFVLFILVLGSRGILDVLAVAFLVRAFGCLYHNVDFICLGLDSLLDAGLVWVCGFLGFSPWLTGVNLVCVGLVNIWVGDGPVLSSVEVFVDEVWSFVLTSAIFSVVHHEIEPLLIHAVVLITNYISIRVLWITWEHSFSIMNIRIISRIISISYHIWTLALIIGELTILNTISRCWSVFNVSTLKERSMSIVAVVKALVQAFIGHLNNSSIALFVHQWAMIHQLISVVQWIHGHGFHLLILENRILQHSLLLNVLLVNFSVGPSRRWIAFLVMLHIKLTYVICCIHRLLYIRQLAHLNIPLPCFLALWPMFIWALPFLLIEAHLETSHYFELVSLGLSLH